MCKAGEVEGAVLDGSRWRIPEEFVAAYAEAHTEPVPDYDAASNDDRRRRPLPIGISDYRKAVTQYYYVDKTLLIRDILDHRAQVSLFTRPRRFGKTLNMDMLRVFFELSEEDSSRYFRDKSIWRCGDEYTSLQGTYPVVYLSFKDVKYSSWDKALSNISSLIITEYDRHRYLLDSGRCSENEKKFFMRILDGEAAEEELADALRLLSHMLRQHHDRHVIVMIDEYDTPIQEGFVAGYYDQVTEFIRNLFSGGLKDNPDLEFGFLTGILRVAKESIFSGMNNLKVYGITDELYSEYFGFTSDRMDEVCEWYDGYRFGSHEIFNPWSVINYIDDGCIARAYWQSTGSSEIIGDIISAVSGDTADDLLSMMQGGSVYAYIDSNVIYPEVAERPSSIFSFLLMTGYLRLKETYHQPDGNDICEVSIPNREISYVYEKEIIERYPVSGMRSTAVDVQRAIFSKDIDRLQKALGDYITEAVSYYDPSGEGFYQGLMLGLCAMLNNRYIVRSNRESGYGRFDIQLEPVVRSLPGFIFELKFADDADADLDGMIGDALRQIEDKKYDTELRSRGVTEIIKVGMAFAGKRIKVARM